MKLRDLKISEILEFLILVVLTTCTRGLEIKHLENINPEIKLILKAEGNSQSKKLLNLLED